ncbi:YAP-binding/ALF4/Glomulin [Stachybotrys elegans]|uniref:YAP-binding/ALF4/Glomulin n=1 Tax=Stachybotrys elegans TaxID=80388 RepID=A0A8K0SRJ2_9HYPO|nr:YAP-binding/ALF4/Glomulin [Stachybotrys elegans]
MADVAPNPAPSMDEVVKRLMESRPPATDSFTYLTIVEKSLSPEILPSLQEILEDAELTNEIGWDLVEMLISVPGSEQCLETIARLGNPREVILKVLEVMDKNTDPETEAAEIPHANRKFITLVGMLGILHRRLQVRAPSRFLHTTLDTVYRAYDPTSAEATAAVVDLARSLSGRKRPPLPSRQSSTLLETPFQDSDPSKSAPDPEADKAEHVNEDEPELITKLLQSFITCIIEAYANSNSMEWASRLLEYTMPERIVPGRPTMMQAFKEVDELRARDALVGQLVAAAGDLGLSSTTSPPIKETFSLPVRKDPLADELDTENPTASMLSTGGVLCLTAYWMFATDVFDAHHDCSELYIFPHHHDLLARFLGEDPETQIASNLGTTEAFVVILIWLQSQGRIIKDMDIKDGAEGTYMSYLHILTLISVFHPNVRTRNATTVLAGTILHTIPKEEDRLAILEDLLENCIFSSLQACAVSWLREEIIAARKAGTKGRFGSPECFDTLQYALFPDLSHLANADTATLWDFWTGASAFHLQVANFALFLFRGEDYKALAPTGMAVAIEHRYVDPLLHVSKALQEAVEKKEVEAGGMEGEVVTQLGILADTLGRIPLQ